MTKSTIMKVLTLFLAAAMILPCFAFSVSARGGEPVTVRVGTYNIQYGKNPGMHLDFSVLAADVIGAELDIVGFQEVDKNTGRNGGQDTMAILSEATGYQYYRFAPALNFSVGQLSIIWRAMSYWPWSPTNRMVAPESFTI